MAENTTVETKFPLLHKSQDQRNVQIPKPEVKAEEAKPAEEPVVVAAAATSEPIAVPPAFSFKDLDEKAKLKEINETLGTNFKSLDEAKPKAPAKTKEQLDAEKEANKAKALEWALGTNKIKKEEYDSAIVEKAKSPRQIALKLFTEELREDNPKITEAEAEEQFKDYYHEEAEEDSPLRKLGIKKMIKTAENYLKSSFGSLDTYEADYEAYTTSEANQENYGRQVKNVIEALPKELKFSVPYKGIDGTETQLEYIIPIEDADIKAAKKDFLTPEMYQILGADKEEVADKIIAGELESYIKTKRFNSIIAKIATEHGAKVEQDVLAKLKNIPATQTHLAGQQTAPTQKTPPAPHTLLRTTQDKQYGQRRY